MKKLLCFTRLMVCLCAVLTSTSAFAKAQWIGSSYINVNETWYQAHGTESWASGGAFDGKDLGGIGSLAVGGQLQIGDNGADWLSGAGDWMHYAIYSGETSVMTGDINLAYAGYGYGGYNNNMRFQSGGSTFTASYIDISSLSNGSTYTLEIWFGPIDGKYEYESSATKYSATFIKRIDINGASVTGVNSSYEWTGSAIQPVPVVTFDGNELRSGEDFVYNYSDEGCTDGGDYSVIITGKGTYAGMMVVDFSILVPTGYYLVGTMNGWGLNKNYILSQNTNNTSEYYIRNVVLSATDELKVVHTDDGKTKNEYFPAGSNYMPGKGTWDIYFRPDKQGGSGWHENTLFASAQSSINVALAPTGYGTYYNGQCELTLPTGVVAYVLNDATPTYEKIADGDGDGTTVKNTVPAGVAVLLYSASKPERVTLNLNTVTSDSRTFTNLLHGSDVESTTTGGAPYYKLTYGSIEGHTDIFGWYYGADGGAAFTSPAHKAWLALSNSASRGFLDLPDEDATGIASVANKQQNADNVWYDLNGRRINAPKTKGVYVKDGRKLVIK